MSYKEELYKNAFHIFEQNFNGEKNRMESVKKVVDLILKQSQSNLLDQKIDEEGNIIEMPKMDDCGAGLSGCYGAPHLCELFVTGNCGCHKYKNTTTIGEKLEELKRLKEENEKLTKTNSDNFDIVINNGKELSKANKKIEELKGLLNMVDMVVELGEPVKKNGTLQSKIKESLTK